MRATASIRLAWLAFLALLLAIRSLAPAGFMPAFDHGAVTIVACPDASVAAHPVSMHHQGDHKTPHQTCPYAAASALGAVWPDWTPLLAIAFFAAALLLGRSFLFLERHGGRERPPSRGPPIPA
jgi:hypothetical protein